MRKLVAFFSLLVIFNLVIFQENNAKEIKLLVLIISSDYCPIDECSIYLELQKVWKSYMHYNPTQIESYFIRADAEMPTKFKIEDDVIWAKTKEGWPPASDGIIKKTILALDAISPRLHEFDYILRTNLSSFYVFPRLLKFLETLPRKGCYCGSGEGFASGCGFILSSDLVKLLIAHKNEFLDKIHYSDDDVLIGAFFKKHGIKLLPHSRLDLLTLDIWNQMKNKINASVFQFRIKNDNHSARLTEDLQIYSDLLKMFYK